jgi:putative transposase
MDPAHAGCYRSTVAAGISPLKLNKRLHCEFAWNNFHLMPNKWGKGDFFSGQGVHRSFYLPRLTREHYQGDAVVHWTLPVALRATGWLDATFHAHFREVMLHAAAREALLCPVYCLMPDHLHLLWMGLHQDSDQRSGMKFLREHLGPALHPHRFQHQAHDHVLREDERKRGAFAKVCFYILANPIRAGLMPETGTWPDGGAVVPGYPVLNPWDGDYWPIFWKIYDQSHHPDAGQILRK